MVGAWCFGLAALALGLLAGDAAIVASVLNDHHSIWGVVGAVAGAFAVDAVVLSLIAMLIEAP